MTIIITDKNSLNYKQGRIDERKELIEKVKKMIDEWDFYDLREDLRLFAFDDDKDYVSEFKRKVKQQLQELQEKK